MSLDTMQSNLFSDALEQSYRVQIEEFEGPLDLLLHLIKKNEVDIYNIPIAAITRQYLEYMELMKELNLDIAGEFLVMAATLLQIKSRMLLPATQEEDGEAEVEDPRAELVRRLLEYQRYRDASQLLSARNLLGRDVFARTFDSPELAEMEPQEEPADVELFELIEAFQRVLARVSVDTFHDVVADGISIADRIGVVLSVLHAEKTVCFDALFTTGMTRDLLVVTFLSILELAKMKLIRVVQVESLGSIWLTLSADQQESGLEQEGGEPQVENQNSLESAEDAVVG
ncbi:chromosome segregation and condensation protein ScpA [Citrifermentans bemidjiense Bem]|uniref:Segregation and condensation protein A n=1 Tax=Citrifermentans bemidjiense (strain ATCC BAA-1014 / DSM 16622 / JCM 12645 / Bem) TaxID=404380 RepID=B5EEG4_CITBB|nr:segregation/condensation protein A [Citrifermentans bemidjiense]ACH39309.1 chromosome segregation and condensation protein ScpA [Citrifermentans bemidjiense Bem]